MVLFGPSSFERSRFSSYRIDAERRLNDAYVAERNIPPPVYGW